MFKSEVHLFQIEDIFNKIFLSRQVSRLDINTLNLAMMSGCLDEEETSIVARIFYGVRRGWLEITDLSLQETQSVNPRKQCVINLDMTAGI